MTLLVIILVVVAVVALVRLARPSTLQVVIRCRDCARHAADRVAVEVRRLGYEARVEVDEDVADFADDDGSPVSVVELSAIGRRSATVEQRVVDDWRMSEHWRGFVGAWCRGERR